MKKLVMVCGLLLGAVSLTFAQDGTHKRMSAEDRAKKSTEKLSERLKLTEEQKAQVLAIYTEQAAEMAKSRAAETDVQKTKYAGMKAKMEANDAKIKALLTADQQKAYDEMKAERKAKMHKRGDKTAPVTTMQR